MPLSDLASIAKAGVCSRGNVHIHYFAIGDGPPLILQHGFTLSAERWNVAGFVDALKNHYRLVLIDARGHGKSSKLYDPAAYTHEIMAADVLAVMDEIGIGRAVYWGYSMGAAIGFALGRLAPERFTAFVLGGGHPYGGTIPDDARFDGSDPEAAATKFLRRLKIANSLDELSPERRKLILDNDFRALAAVQQDRPSQADALARMTMPCLVYVGGGDVIREKAERAAAELSDCRLATIGDLDHGAAFMNSGQVVPVVLSFLQTI